MGCAGIAGVTKDEIAGGGLAAASRNKLGNEPNKSGCEPTSDRSKNYESGRLIPVFRGIGRIFSSLFLLHLDAAFRA
jgi:hypothetical protein